MEKKKELRRIPKSEWVSVLDLPLDTYNRSFIQKKDQTDFVHNFDKFKCTSVVFSMQHRDSNLKLPIQV